MDYDKTNIPVTYDLGRDHGPAFTARWMTEIARRVSGRSIYAILDLGCGTGAVFQRACRSIRCPTGRNRSLKEDARTGAREDTEWSRELCLRHG